MPLAADRTGPAPPTVQIVGQLRTAMTDGHLAAGERLPSTRALAATLGVSRTVVTGAYAQLFAEGWIEGRHGSGTYVADGAQGGPAAPGGLPLAGRGRAGGAPGWLPSPGTGTLIELRPGIAWTEGIDPAAWRRAWRSAGAQPPARESDPRGNDGLRGALVGYLRRGRGVRCSVDQL